MTVIWIKDGFSLLNGTNSSTLNIGSINRLQGGIYSCEGTNNVATIRRSICVSVVCKYICIYTVKFLLSDHPQGKAKWSLKGRFPLDDFLRAKQLFLLSHQLFGWN